MTRVGWWDEGARAMTTVGLLWVYLSASPLMWLSLTLLAYLGAAALHRRFGGHPLLNAALNPVLIAVTGLIGVLVLTETPYRTYFDGAQFVHFLLGPATVALAVPLIENLERVRRALVPMAAALVAGSLTGIVSAVGLGALFGGGAETLASLAPKSVTTPIAMAVSERLGGLASLTAALVIATGILGAVIAVPLLDRLGLVDLRARGFAIGTAAHGVGTARAFQIDPVAGTFSGVAMALNGLLTALLAPLLASWLL